MQIARARFRVPSGETVLCYPGDLVGRMSSARVRIGDPGISEAHAMVSLRGDRLWLLFLRNANPAGAWHVELHPGLSIPLTRDLGLEVVDVHVPSERLVLTLPDGRRAVVGDGKYGFDPSAEPFLVPGGSRATVWSAGSESWIRTDTGIQLLEPEQAYSVNGVLVTASVGDAEAGGPAQWTELAITSADPMFVELHSFDRVVVAMRGKQCTLTGHSAVLVHTIAKAGGRAGWMEVAIALYGGKRAPEKRDDLRDNVLYRLDRRLREKGLRDDLVVRKDGTLEFGPGVTFAVPAENGPSTSSRQEGLCEPSK